jgi:hypothetical protein
VFHLSNGSFYFTLYYLGAKSELHPCLSIDYSSTSLCCEPEVIETAFAVVYPTTTATATTANNSNHNDDDNNMSHQPTLFTNSHKQPVAPKFPPTQSTMVPHSRATNNSSRALIPPYLPGTALSSPLNKITRKRPFQPRPSRTQLGSASSTNAAAALKHTHLEFVELPPNNKHDDSEKEEEEDDDEELQQPQQSWWPCLRFDDFRSMMQVHEQIHPNNDVLKHELMAEYLEAVYTSASSTSTSSSAAFPVQATLAVCQALGGERDHDRPGGISQRRWQRRRRSYYHPHLLEHTTTTTTPTTTRRISLTHHAYFEKSIELYQHAKQDPLLKQAMDEHDRLFLLSNEPQPPQQQQAAQTDMTPTMTTTTAPPGNPAAKEDQAPSNRSPSNRSPRKTNKSAVVLEESSTTAKDSQRRPEEQAPPPSPINQKPTPEASPEEQEQEETVPTHPQDDDSTPVPMESEETTEPNGSSADTPNQNRQPTKGKKRKAAAAAAKRNQNKKKKSTAKKPSPGGPTPLYKDTGDTLSIPKWSEVQPLLELSGHVFYDDVYCRPFGDLRDNPDATQGVDYFRTKASFRAYLCAHGVEYVGAPPWRGKEDDQGKVQDSPEEQIIESWVRCSILTLGTDALRNSVVPELVMKKNQGLKLLKQKLGVRPKNSKLEDGYVLPGSSTTGTRTGTATNILSENRLWQHFARHGLPSNLTFENTDHKHRLALEQFIAKEIKMDLL